MTTGKRIRAGIALVVLILIVMTAYHYYVDTHAPVHIDSQDRPVRDICSEMIYGKIDKAGKPDTSKTSHGKCTTHSTPLFHQYVIADKTIYWMEQYDYNHTPCITDTGDTVGLIYNLSWDCFTARPRQINAVSERSFYAVAPDTSSFQPLKSAKTDMVEWQKKQLTNYGRDNKTVYYHNWRLEGANPATSSVIFPFGNDKKWALYSVVTDGEKYFFNGQAMPDVDLRHFRVLKPVKCPGHGLSRCTFNDDAEEFFKYGNWDGSIPGVVGNDIVILQQFAVSRFPNMASPDTFLFASSQALYFYSNGKFFQIVEDRENGGKKPVEIDIASFDDYY